MAKNTVVIKHDLSLQLLGACCNVLAIKALLVLREPLPIVRGPSMPEAKEKEKWFGMRLTPAQKERIERLAERRGTTQKKAVLCEAAHLLGRE